MGSNSPISKLVNAIHDETLELEVDMLKRRIQHTDTPSFFMGYCAAETSLFERVVKYMQDQVAPKVKQPMEIALEPDLRNLRGYFLQHIGELQAEVGDVVLVKVSGFEGLSSLNPGYGIAHRVAHDYDQDVCQNQDHTFKGLDKKVLVITYIDPSKGREAYELAVGSACNSQFKSFIYEFR